MARAGPLAAGPPRSRPPRIRVGEGDPRTDRAELRPRDCLRPAGRAGHLQQGTRRGSPAGHQGRRDCRGGRGRRRPYFCLCLSRRQPRSDGKGRGRPQMARAELRRSRRARLRLDRQRRALQLGDGQPPPLPGSPGEGTVESLPGAFRPAGHARSRVSTDPGAPGDPRGRRAGTGAPAARVGDSPGGRTGRDAVRGPHASRSHLRLYRSRSPRRCASNHPS